MANVGYAIQRSGWQQKPPLGVQLNHAHPLTKGLVGCWLFNEGGGDKVYDLSGHNNHGTLENMAIPATTASGWNPSKDGFGLKFDALNDFVDCSGNSSLDISSAITIVAIVRNTKSGLVGYERLITKYKATDNQREWRLQMDADEKLSADFFADGAATNKIVVKSDNAIPSINSFHQFVVTFSSGSCVLYDDGSPILSTISTGGTGCSSIFNGNAKLYISNYDGGFSSFGGVIDHNLVYNRVLTADEIQQLYMTPYAMFEPATKYTIIDEALRTKHVGTNVAAAQMLRGRTVI